MKIVLGCAYNDGYRQSETFFFEFNNDIDHKSHCLELSAHFFSFNIVNQCV